MEKSAKIYVAGHNGMVGSAILRKLKKEGFTNIIIRNSSELDLTDQRNVNDFFEKEKLDGIYEFYSKLRPLSLSLNLIFYFYL